MSDLVSILSPIKNIKVIDLEFNTPHFTAIDLSKSNIDLAKFNCDDPLQFEEYITSYVLKNNAKVAFGGYNEIRSLYKRSEIFNAKDLDERNIHIGLDLWIHAGTSVLAALDGKVHSFKNNLGLGNYGPTIILEHCIENTTFYTLYGHLSADSISNLQIGATFKKGEQIAALGNCSVNGNYAPHLHFQIIKNLNGYFGDYPGVSSKAELSYFLANCPDPNILLKL